MKFINPEQDLNKDFASGTARYPSSRFDHLVKKDEQKLMKDKHKKLLNQYQAADEEMLAQIKQLKQQANLRRAINKEKQGALNTARQRSRESTSRSPPKPRQAMTARLIPGGEVVLAVGLRPNKLNYYP